jgi:aminopeptidase N
MRSSERGNDRWILCRWILMLAVWFGFAVASTFADDARRAGSALASTLDVLHYKIEVELDMSRGMLGGRITLTTCVNSAVSEILLNAACLSIDHATVNAEVWSPSIDSANESVTLHSPGTILAAGDTVTVVVEYRRVPGIKRPGGRWGYYFFLDTLGLPSNLGYTMAEPSDARFWMPCVDTPTDKATVELFVTVPRGYVAASNGRLLGVINTTDSTTVWQWEESHPIATYLIAITASRFSISTLPFVRAEGDTVPLQYYVWPEDSLECAGYLPTVRDMIVGLSKIFGPYPFDKYGMTAIVPFGFGGMEHQTITTMNRYVKTDERVVLHELAHQWWGDLVTCGTWKDVWLNESFATYAEALWEEQKSGRYALRLYMNSNLAHFFYGSWQGGPYDPEGQGFNLFDDVVYSKGAWVLHMLRGVVGDSTFFHALHHYRDLYASRTATTEDLKAVLDTVSGQNIDWFFAEWVYGRGWPVYNMSYTWAADTLHLTLTQNQEAAWPVFRIPLQVRVENDFVDTLVTIKPDARVYQTSVYVPFQPARVLLDPDSLVLKQVANTASVTHAPEQPATFSLEQNYPNPFNPTTTIRFSIAGVVALSGSEGPATKVRLAVYDLLGREVAVLVNEEQLPGRYEVKFDGARLPSGVYFVRLQAGRQTAVKSMLLVR